MKPRLLDAVLLLVVLAGAIAAWQTGRERSRLSERYERLVRITGDLPVDDPTKVYIQRLETGKPLDFAWRVHLPPNFNSAIWSSTGIQSTGWARSASDFLARVRIREEENGLLQIYERFARSSSRSSFGDEALAQLLRGRWGAIRVEQLGAAGPAELKPGQAAVRLRLTLPDELAFEGHKTLDAHAQSQFVPVLFELNLGPKPPNR
jgi:hypothetical protein